MYIRICILCMLVNFWKMEFGFKWTVLWASIEFFKKKNCYVKYLYKFSIAKTCDKKICSKATN